MTQGDSENSGSFSSIFSVIGSKAKSAEMVSLMVFIAASQALELLTASAPFSFAVISAFSFDASVCVMTALLLKGLYLTRRTMVKNWTHLLLARTTGKSGRRYH